MSKNSKNSRDLSATIYVGGGMLTFLMFTVVLVATLGGCTSQPKNQKENTISGHSVKDTANLMLFQVWQHYYPKSTVKQTASGLQFDGTTVSITPTVENHSEHDGKFINGIRFDVALNGKALNGLTYGCVGIDDSAEESTKTTIRDWAIGFGLPLIDALENGERSIKIDGISFYYSPMAIRGLSEEKPGDWVDGSKKMNEKIITAAMPVLKKDSKGFDYTSMQLTIVVDPKGPLRGQCRLDGAESEALLSAMQKLDWPVEKGYMFKQCYVFRNATGSKVSE